MKSNQVDDNFILAEVMAAMHWRAKSGENVCIWIGCNRERVGPLLCAWHRRNPDGRRIGDAAPTQWVDTETPSS